MTNATQNQVQALRKFRVPEETIQTLDFDEASAMLDKLIAKAKAAKANGSVKSNTESYPTPFSEAVATLTDATKIVMAQFRLNDMSEISDAHIAVIQEVSRQLYGLKYWVEKSSPRLTGQPNNNKRELIW